MLGHGPPLRSGCRRKRADYPTAALSRQPPSDLLHLRLQLRVCIVPQFDELRILLHGLPALALTLVDRAEPPMDMRTPAGVQDGERIWHGQELLVVPDRRVGTARGLVGAPHLDQ